MNGMFQQKQRELVVAVSRVEELSRQLEMLRSGKMDDVGPSSTGELERLYKELQVHLRYFLHILLCMSIHNVNVM